MQTFLDLCNSFIKELGINGGNQLTTVTSNVNSLESIRICDFVADADYEIQSLHHNWKFLWRQFRSTLAVGADVLATPSVSVASHQFYQFRKIDRESVVFNYSDPQLASRPRWQEWRKFESLWQSRGAKSVSNSPPFWSQTPAGNPIVSTVMSDVTPYQYECWARPQRMRSDGDVSPIIRAVALENTGITNFVPPFTIAQPSADLSGTTSATKIVVKNFPASSGTARLESARIIIARAMVLYATVEGATDIMQSALAEYEDLYEELRADQLPGQENDRVSEADVPMTVETY